MRDGGGGYFSAIVPEAGAGGRYRFRLDGGEHVRREPLVELDELPRELVAGTRHRGEDSP